MPNDSWMLPMGSRTKKKGYTAADWDAAGPMLGGASDSGRNSTNESWQLTPPKDGTLPGRGPNGEMPFGSQPGTGKVNQPRYGIDPIKPDPKMLPPEFQDGRTSKPGTGTTQPGFDLYPPKDEFPTDGRTNKPGTGTTQPPYSDTPPLPQMPDDTGKPGANPYGKWGNSDWNMFETWSPGQDYRGAGWNPGYQVPIPSTGTEEQIAAANFLNYFNQLVPLLSPQDLSNYAQQVNQALDAMDDEPTKEYFRGLMRGTSALGLQTRNTANLWDRDRLGEARRALTGMMQTGDIDNEEVALQNAIDLLDMILGVDATGGGVSAPGIWGGTGDRPMTRREREQYWDKVNTYAGGVDENDPFANLIMGILNPTGNTPMLNTYIHAPQRYAPTGSAYTYGYSTPRY
jgi:hypothetical protein